jgi:Ca-activated chloride channel family protein
MKRRLPLLLLSLATLLMPVSEAAAQSSAQVVIPQARPWTRPFPGGQVQLMDVEARIEISDQVATTTLDLALTNASGSRLESELIIPVPDGAVLRGFDFQGAAKEPTAKLLTKEEARKTYDAIVAQTRDPALLEFIGCNLIRSSVFPVEPRAGQKVRVVYEQLLPADGSRVDYFLPRSESVEYQVPWRITVSVKSTKPIATIYSPSHEIVAARSGSKGFKATLAPGALNEPGPFRLSVLREDQGITASLLAYPDPKIGGGYFLLLAGTPAKAPETPRQKREVILVLDRSGSMAGEKLEQVRAAALQVIEGLDDGEAFNLIVFNEGVESFAPEPVIKDAETMRAARAYLKNLRVRGGTNIHDALVEALRARPRDGFFPLVLFLTDGLPTVGQTSEKTIRELAAQGNPHQRRLFTFGVGVDVNTPLLDRIAQQSRAVATFVLPREDVEVKVGRVFRRLLGPVLAAPSLRAVETGGKPAFGRVRDLLPSALPDLFDGDQLVLFGQYTGAAPLKFELTGNYFGQERTFRFDFPLDKATVQNAFIPRLWASRRIALLTDAIRDLGMEPGANPTNDPRAKELVTEIVKLSQEFGILTEYTAFFASEGTDLAEPELLRSEAQKQFRQRAMSSRSGASSVNQELNNGYQRSKGWDNRLNKYRDAELKEQCVTTVQQVNNGTFYKQGNAWVECAVATQKETKPARVVEIGSPEFRTLVERLVRENRQSCFAMIGELLLEVGGERVLIR